MKIKLNKLRENAQLPAYQTDGAAGADIFACLPGMGLVIPAGEVRLVSAGISVEIPEGYELQVRSRSGLSMAGLVVANAPGTIDSDYRGEIFVMIRNMTREAYYVSHGDRIAQLVLNKVERIEWHDGELKPTKRGKRGIGSTGI